MGEGVEVGRWGRQGRESADLIRDLILGADALLHIACEPIM